MKTRDEIQTDILLEADAPTTTGALNVRPVSFASLLLLRKLGNPLAKALENGGAVGTESLEAIAEFLWVQCAPWDEVRRVACGADRARLEAAVLDFAAALTPQQIQVAVAAIANHGKQLAAVAAEVLPDKDTPAGSKN